MRRFLIILLMLISIPTYAYADIVGKHDKVRLAPPDQLGVHFVFGVTNNDDMYLLYGIKFHLVVRDDKTKEKIIEDDYTFKLSDFGKGNYFILTPQTPASFEVVIKNKNLEKCDVVSTTVTNLIPIEEYVPVNRRYRIIQGKSI